MAFDSNLNKTNELRSLTSSPLIDSMVSLFDDGSFVELDPYMVSDTVMTGYGKINGRQVYAYSQNIEAMSGAVSSKAVQKILKIYNLALKTGAPIIGMFDSFGAKLDEGVAALSAYGEWMAMVNNLSGVVPQISLIMGTCAGCAAIIACSADIIIMKKDAKLFLNGSLNSDVDSSQNAVKSGLVHMVCCDNNETINKAKDIISMLPQNNLSIAANLEFSENDDVVSSEIDGCELIEAVSDKGSVIELQKGFGDCVVTSFA
ncbi:MAG: carboxyl transferase, partial [Oscillospiraceae bacterium]|nr:carboxyl transferase [Oscillospiraceae bacterium]